MVQTEARGETGATMEGMVEEKGIVPERSEWFRSSRIIGTAPGQGVYIGFPGTSEKFSTLEPYRLYE